MGNRVFGCDDCQLVCPWNRYAQHSPENDFSPRNKLNDIELVELFSWTEEEFLSKTEGSPIRRIGYECWLRNIAVGLGNAPKSETIIKALESKKDYPSELVREHVEWALENINKTTRLNAH
jgi:epoxyqueuosine reductase